MTIPVAIMIEGQNGLNWPRWQTIAYKVEEAGLAGLYRSDHFTNSEPPDLDSLELWTSLAWLASHTRQIEFGPLVTPVSFRDPVMTARIARDVDALANGRLTLGLGAGWQEREHDLFGYELLDVPARFRRFEEALQIITRLLRSPDPVTFQGDYYRLREASLVPRPQRAGGPPILIGGVGSRYTLPLVARYADEWNAVLIPAERLAQLNARLDDMLREAGRAPANIRRSIMTGVVFGRTQAELERQLVKRDRAKLAEKGVLVGGPEEIRAGLRALEQAGAQCAMLQWLDLDDMDGLQALAEAVLNKQEATCRTPKSS